LRINSTINSGFVKAQWRAAGFISWDLDLPQGRSIISNSLNSGSIKLEEKINPSTPPVYGPFFGNSFK